MKKVLLIDDLPENVFLLQDRLDQEGFETITAYDGQSGIQKAITELPDLILLDVMMPGVSGIDVCRTLINNPATGSIPIILVTARSGAEDIKEGLEAGAFDYIKKPFSLIELMARINSALKYSESQKMLRESDQKDTFDATVVTTNHKIKQPLTLISLSSAAIKREINKEEISREGILKRLGYIDSAIKDINEVLNQLNQIKKPVISTYFNNIKMVEMDSTKGENSD